MASLIIALCLYGYLPVAEPDVASLRIEKANPLNKTHALRQPLKLS